jgi:hypothetical protein
VYCGNYLISIWDITKRVVPIRVGSRQLANSFISFWCRTVIGQNLTFPDDWLTAGMQRDIPSQLENDRNAGNSYRFQQYFRGRSLEAALCGEETQRNLNGVEEARSPDSYRDYCLVG